MTMLSDAQLAMMRAIRVKSLHNSCSIYDALDIPNATKGNVQSWPAVSRTVPCNILRRQITSGDFDNIMVEFHYEFVLPFDTPVAAPAHIVPVTGDHVGKTFEVSNVIPPGSYDNTVRAYASELTDV
jgi:hypothetical protein